MPKYIVTPEEAGQKCIAFVQKKMNIPTHVVHGLIRKGVIRINAKRCKPFMRVVSGDSIFLPIHMQDNVVDKNNKELGTIAKDFLQEYSIYEDNSLLVLNKPAGIPVHNGTRHSISIASYIQEAYLSSSFMPTLVHRLDKDTTGILLIAKTYTQLQKLHTAWRCAEVKKYYLAWVKGLWEKEGVTYIEHSVQKQHNGVIVQEGKGSAISVRCLEKRRNSSLMLIVLHTGKTHQIRAQLSYYSFPILGESVYANNSKDMPLFLHATALYVNDDMQYCILPQHWHGAFKINTVLPSTAQEYSQYFI